MSSSNQNDRTARRWHDSLLIGLGLPTVYLLSTGPIARLMQEGIISQDIPLLEVLYAPVGWAMEHSPVVCDAVFAYLYLWGVRIS